LSNFDRLSSSVGPDCLVVKGANPEGFYNSLIDSQLGKLVRENKAPVFTENSKSKWSWIAEYLEVKPNFFGLGINLNPLLDDIFGKQA